jgi:membrane dipeptidase
MRSLILNFAGILILLPVSILSQQKVSEKRVQEVHQKALTVDTHVDTPMALLNKQFDIGKRNKAPESRVDFIRMKEGGLDAVFFAAYTPQREITTENTEKAYRLAHQMIETTHSACKKYNNMAEIALTSADASRLKSEGKSAVYIGLENGFPLGTDLTRLKEFYNRGVRYITLSHSKHNEICDSSSDQKPPLHNGLSSFGKEVVDEMNKLGIIIDVSHVSDKSFYDIIHLSKAPVIASHSSVRTIARHHRNMNDEMIKALSKNGGVIQICLLDDYIKDPDTSSLHFQKKQELRNTYNTRFDTMTDEEQQIFRQAWTAIDKQYPKKLPTVVDLVDHIDYVKNLVGIDYVGIGSDFDGGGGLADCKDVSEFPNITHEMLRRNYTEEEILKVWGGNFFRVFSEVEQLRDVSIFKSH